MTAKRKLILLTVCLAVAITAGVFFYYALYAEYESVVEQYADEEDYELTLAVMRAESGFDEQAVSNAGAVGLMQLMPSTAEWLWERGGYGAELSAEELFNPEINVLLGADYLEYLTDKFELPFALAAYNAGEGVVSDWKKQGVKCVRDIPYPETRRYVRRVTFFCKMYKLFL